MSTPMTPTAQDFEKLGAFYLGREYDLEGQKRLDNLVLYDSRDLVTHAVCVGMTGSGKTGLCIDLIEEAAIDGIPAILIDPKGDLSNLLLTFPNLQPGDFRPWVNAEDAERKGLTPDAFAAQQAALWTKGLSEWGQDGARIQRLRDAADFTIYTPGSMAGTPVSVLRTFEPPSQAVIDDEELFRDQLNSTASSILAIAGSGSNPIRQTAHVLLVSILATAWRRGQAIDLSTLVEQIIRPPFSTLGVMPIDTAMSPTERAGFAQALNTVVASPTAQAWTSGVPLDIGAFLRSSNGKPRISIFSISHLTDAERMFFVSLLLSRTLSWVRSQSGTTSLRALLYMDEIAGYFPPTANPPSKGPLLTLMKQGRAFGMGVVLATQNPVDIDYKGLSNAGTWFIGRLQTERDKARVLDGLEGAAANSKGGFDRGEVDKMLSRLGARVFLMNNIHEDGPVVFESRWALSYLRGPLTREQIKQVSNSELANRNSDGSTGATKPASSPSLPSSESRVPSSATRPVLPPDVPQYFIPSRNANIASYRPMLLGCAKVYYSDAKAQVETDALASLMVPVGDGPVIVDWEHAEETDITDKDLEREPSGGTAVTFDQLPADATKAKSYDSWKKQFADAVFRSAKLELLRNTDLGELSKPGESERDFRARIDIKAREERDAQIERLRAKYTPKMAALQDRLRRAEQTVAVQKEQSTAAKISTALSVGTAIFGAFLGRKTISAGNISKAATAARGVGRSMKESSDVGRAEENVEALTAQLQALNDQLKSETDALTAASEASAAELEKITLKPKKTNITVRTVVLAWAPVGPDGANLWE